VIVTILCKCPKKGSFAVNEFYAKKSSGSEKHFYGKIGELKFQAAGNAF
jgi:hypothetical protein